MNNSNAILLCLIIFPLFMAISVSYGCEVIYNSLDTAAFFSRRGGGTFS